MSKPKPKRGKLTSKAPARKLLDKLTRTLTAATLVTHSLRNGSPGQQKAAASVLQQQLKNLTK